MTKNQAEHFRRQAEDCLDRAEIAPDALSKQRMRKLAGQWLSKAAKAAAKEQSTNRVIKQPRPTKRFPW